MQEVDLTLIKMHRKEKKIPLREMAELLGFKNASTYYKYEIGAYKFDANHLPLISKKLGIKMNDIFFTQKLAKSAN